MHPEGISSEYLSNVMTYKTRMTHCNTHLLTKQVNKSVSVLTNPEILMAGRPLERIVKVLMSLIANFLYFFVLIIEVIISATFHTERNSKMFSEV